MFGSIVDKERYPELSTGCTTFLPSGARCAMGARGTWVTRNDIAIYWGGRFGEESDVAELNGWLREFQETLRAFLRARRTQIDRAPTVLYRDDIGVVYAYGNDSSSYVYLAAVLRSHLPPEFDWQKKTQYAYWGGGA